MASSDRVFTLFPLLPPELRLLIFTFALPSPRDFYFYPPKRWFTRLHDAETKQRLRSSTFPYPGLFCVNTESRQLALRHYQLYYLRIVPKDIRSREWTVWVKDPDAEGGIVAGIYWDSERDMALYSKLHGSLSLPIKPHPLPVKNVCLFPSTTADWQKNVQRGDTEKMMASNYLKDVQCEFPEMKRLYGVDFCGVITFLADVEDLPDVSESSESSKPCT